MIGVDIGRASVKVVQLGFGRKGATLRYAGLTELAPADDEPAAELPLLALQELFRQGGGGRQKLALNVISRPPVVRYLTMPPMPKEELREAVRWEAKKLVPLPLEEMVLDYLVIGEIEDRGVKRIEVLLVAAERVAIQAQLAALEPLRPRIAALDVNPLALLNALRLNYKNDLTNSLAYVDIGAAKMDISIARGGMLRFTRNVQMGGDDITKTIMRDLQVDRAEAEQLKRQKGLSADATGERDQRLRDAIKEAIDRLVLEVQRSIDYYRAQFRDSDIRKIVLMGGTGLMSGFPEYFATYFDTKTELDDPFAEIICDDPAFGDLRLMAPRFSSSVGLALRESA